MLSGVSGSYLKLLEVIGSYRTIVSVHKQKDKCPFDRLATCKSKNFMSETSFTSSNFG